MHVRMMEEMLAPRVQNRQETDFCSEVAGMLTVTPFRSDLALDAIDRGGLDRRRRGAGRRRPAGGAGGGASWIRVA